MDDTRGEEYARRLQVESGRRWKTVLDVQAPYRWNLRRQHLGRTLDVGCGIGRHLSTLPPGSVGVDHNAASIAEARRRGHTALTSEEWSTSELREPGAFDALLFSHVAEHMPEEDAVALVEGYLEVLRPGGTVMLICPQERGYASDPTHVRFLDFAALADLVQRVGLTETKHYSFPLPRAAGKAFTHNEFCLLARKPV